jgi:hypothetical protein
MRQILFILLTLGCSLTHSLKAQNTGFAGKRVLIKSNAINGLNGFFNSYGAEIAFNRKMTITLGYDAINTEVIQSYNQMETVGTSIIMGSKAQTSYKGIHAEFRKYFSREKPAPYGLFMCATYGNGNLNIDKGTYSEKLFIAEGTQDVTYQISGISLAKFGLGLGYQKPINKWIFIGGQFTFNYVSYGNLIEGLPQHAASGVLKNYGSNLVSMNFFNAEKAIQDQQSRSFGISGNIQLGIMLF